MARTDALDGGGAAVALAVVQEESSAVVARRSAPVWSERGFPRSDHRAKNSFAAPVTSAGRWPKKQMSSTLTLLVMSLFYHIYVKEHNGVELNFKTPYLAFNLGDDYAKSVPTNEITGGKALDEIHAHRLFGTVVQAGHTKLVHLLFRAIEGEWKDLNVDIHLRRMVRNSDRFVGKLTIEEVQVLRFSTIPNAYLFSFQIWGSSNRWDAGE